MIDMQTQPTGAPSLLSSEAEEPSYPKGLCLYLDTDTLRKLGMGDGTLPQVGQTFRLNGMVEVVEVAKESGTTSTDYQVELQVIGMELLPPDDPNEQQAAAKQIAGMYESTTG